MLTQLKTFHAQLREAIAELAAVVSQPVCNDEALSAARLKLTRLSSRRRSLIECSIYPKLHDAPPEDARKIADLRIETAALLVTSSTHIGTWTLRAIRADWRGYQRASAEMRRAMLKRIDREAAILYPLMETWPRQQAA